MLGIKKHVSKGCPKALKEDGNKPRCIQKGPQRASKTRDASREIHKRSPGGEAKPPEAPQRPNKAKKYEKPMVKLMFLRKNIKFLK